MSANSNISYMAAGNILPSRFVKLDSAEFKVAQAGVGDEAIGVSHESLRSAPYPDATVTYAAIAGDPLRVYGFGEQCEVVAGASISVGNYLVPGANGVAVVASANSEYYAIARTSAASGGRVKVQLIRGFSNGNIAT